jgi:hypothetical protein
MRSRLSLVIPLGTALAVVTAPLAAQDPEVPGPSFKDVHSLHDIGSSTISPDGSTIAFTVRTTDWDENRYDTEIWLVRDGGEPFQLTRTPEGSSGGAE